MKWPRESRQSGQEKVAKAAKSPRCKTLPGAGARHQRPQRQIHGGLWWTGIKDNSLRGEVSRAAGEHVRQKSFNQEALNLVADLVT